MDCAIEVALRKLSLLYRYRTYLGGIAWHDLGAGRLERTTHESTYLREWETLRPEDEDDSGWQVASPRYDLSLVAGQLLAATKSPASLAAEEQLRKSSWAEGRTLAVKLLSTVPSLFNRAMSVWFSPFMVVNNPPASILPSVCTASA